MYFTLNTWIWIIVIQKYKNLHLLKNKIKKGKKIKKRLNKFFNKTIIWVMYVLQAFVKRKQRNIRYVLLILAMLSLSIISCSVVYCAGSMFPWKAKIIAYLPHWNSSFKSNRYYGIQSSQFFILKIFVLFFYFFLLERFRNHFSI